MTRNDQDSLRLSYYIQSLKILLDLFFDNIAVITCLSLFLSPIADD